MKYYLATWVGYWIVEDKPFDTPKQAHEALKNQRIKLYDRVIDERGDIVAL